ncbi:MAG: GNAT family N-acetyltransferase [Candidatus Nanopelagicales bacterium]
MSDRRVRPAVPADAERLAHIKVVTWRAAYRGLLPDTVLDDLSVTHFVDQFRDRINATLAADTTAQTALVVEEAAEVVGYGMAGPYRGDDLPQAGEIYALYVEPSAWGHGAGAELLAATESHLVRNGFDRAALWVLASNAAGQGFYRAMGWTPDGERGNHCEIDHAPEVRYRKNLAGGP